MSGGGGGKQATSTWQSPFAPTLGKFGTQLFNMFKPTGQLLSQQTAEGLRTGGVNAQIPLVNANLASARQAYSSSIQNLKNQLGQSGLLNSSFGQQILGQAQMEGGQQIANIPASMTSQFVSGALPTVAGFAQTGTGAIGKAGELYGGGTQQKSFWDYFIQGMQAGGSMMQGMGAMGMGA